MKSLFIPIFLLVHLLPQVAHSQSSTQNYIRTQTSIDGTTSNYVQQVDYFDGLGRPVEQVRCKAGGGGQDLIILTEYDGYGRQAKVWLPASVSGNNGNYMAPATLQNNVKSANGNDAYAFTEQIYENSPLNRVAQVYGPGADWRSASSRVETTYLTNNASYPCGKFTSSDAGTTVGITRSGNYATGELYVTQIKDEDGNIRYEFKDKLGQTVLTRQTDGSTNFDTYYVYDNYGCLRAVLPPLAADALAGNSTYTASTDAILKYAYLYQYDNRLRCIGKKLPGADWIYYVYDQGDRVIFTQDGVLREKGKWRFTIPDAFGRVTLSGTCTNTLSYSGNPLSGKVVGAVWSTSGSFKGYTVNNYTLSGYVLEEVTYYDQYDFLGKNGFPANLTFESRTNYSSSNLATPRGLLTGKITSQAENSGQLYYTAYYYDSRSRLILTRSTNHLGGNDKVFMAYTFDGLPDRRYHEHTAFSVTKKEEYVNAYNDARQEKTVTHYWDGSSTGVSLSSKVYDASGRLSTDTKGGSSNLKTTYGYDLRSRLTGLSETNFSQTLGYTKGSNISSQNWTQNGVSQSYSYSYDGLSRLKSGSYSPASRNSTVSYTYDKHGNPLSIQRNGMTSSSGYGLIDNLTFTYNGNQVTAVNDGASNIPYSFSHDFKNYTNQANEYTYDKNGNQTKDLNRGLSSVTYNSLNLPTRLDVKSPVGEARNEYVYRSDGTKLRVVHKWNPAYSTAPVIGSSVTESSLTKTETTDYLDNFVYVDNVLKRVLLPGGYIENNAYYYYSKDHLGNNRITSNASGTKQQSVNYYPYGMQFGDATGSDVQPYKYSGKEYDGMHGMNLYDSEARYYDPATGRFTTMDPLAEKYYGWSPYAYCLNNPLRFVDPTGMSVEDEDIEKEQRYKSLFDKLLSGINSLFSIEIDSRSPESLSASFDRHEGKINNLGNAVNTLNATTDAISTLLPLGSTITSVAKAASGQELSAGDIGLAAMEIMPFGAVGKIAKGEKVIDIGAKLPVGRSGSVLKEFVEGISRNSPTFINGTKFTGHALDQMQNRGIISPTAVLDVINNPTKAIPGNSPGTSVFFRDKLKVITNKSGDVVSVIWQ